MYRAMSRANTSPTANLKCAVIGQWSHVVMSRVVMDMSHVVMSRVVMDMSCVVMDVFPR